MRQTSKRSQRWLGGRFALLALLALAGLPAASSADPRDPMSLATTTSVVATGSVDDRWSDAQSARAAPRIGLKEETGYGGSAERARDGGPAAGDAAPTPCRMIRFDAMTTDLASAIRFDLPAASANLFFARLVEQFDVFPPGKLIVDAASLAGLRLDRWSGGEVMDGRHLSTVLRSTSFALGGASRLVSGGLLPITDRRLEDAFVVWVPDTHLALTGGYAWLQRATGTGRRRGGSLSLKLTY